LRTDHGVDTSLRKLVLNHTRSSADASNTEMFQEGLRCRECK
jgi:hypothetical protein